MKNLLFILTILVTTAWASRPTIVTIDSRPQFELGTTKNISISDKGLLTKAPQLTQLYSTDTPLILAMATDSKGNIFLGTGNDGQIYKTKTGKDSVLYFQANELAVSALITDAQDNLYAGTFPNGKIYKIQSDGTSSVYFEPKAKYIWDIELDTKGNLYIATGQPAQIIKISANGKKKIMLEPNTEHVRSIAVNQEKLYAGTSGKAFIFEIAQDKKPTVIYDAQTEEITGLFVAKDNTLYASTLGQAVSPVMTGIQRQQTSPSEQQKENGNNNNAEKTPNSQTIMNAVLFSQQVPTALLKINLDGLVQDFWLGKSETIQGISPTFDNGVLVGTGKNGKIYNVSNSGAISLLYELPEQHISTFTLLKDKILLATSNPGNVYQIGPQPADTCQYISQVTDAGMQAKWGKLTFQLLKADKKIKFYTRSGNTEKPNDYWHAWQEINRKTGEIVSPPARFMQWRCDFIDDAELKKVTFSFQQVNFPPRITSIIVHRSGDFYAAEKNINNEDGIIYPAMLPSQIEKKGFRTVDWLFEDPNYDRVKFDLYYRQIDTENWFSMEKDWTLNYYSWDTAQMADGEYEIKIVAHDNQDNAHSANIRSFEITDPFIVDNSGPDITMKKGRDAQGNLNIKVIVNDAFSKLNSAHFSMDTSQWKEMYPQDGILDDKTETFSISLPDKEPHHIAVKIKDSADNYTITHFNIDRH